MPSTSRRRWVWWCLVAYAAVIGVVVLTPVSYGAVIEAIGGWIRETLGLTFFGQGWIEFVANILMFVPLGFLLTLVVRRHLLGVALALLLSVAAELAQVVIPSRVPSVRDVVANVLGAALGALLAWGVERRSRTSDREAGIAAPAD